MPYSRPSLTQLRQQAAADVTSGLPGADGLLRFSNLNVISNVVAGFVNLQYGYLDWIAMQAVPFTSTDEFLQAWAALKRVYLIGASQAIGFWTTVATTGTLVPQGSTMQRGDGFQYITTADATAVANVITCPVQAVLVGATGNCGQGTVITLGNTIPGVTSAGTASVTFTGGADVEDNDSLRTRMLEAYAQTPMGGAANDYEEWALEVPGVSRAWVLRNGQGVGTVLVYFMMDITEQAYGGFPQGANGVAALETRDIPNIATGDQLAVANYIYAPNRQPVTALVYAVAPYPVAVNFTVSSLNPNTSAMQQSIGAAIADCFLRLGSPLVKINMADVQAAINSIPGIIDFVITSPNADITGATGALPVLGTITWTA